MYYLKKKKKELNYFGARTVTVKFGIENQTGTRYKTQ